MTKPKRKPADPLPFPWETHGRDALGTSARIARPDLARATLTEVEGVEEVGGEARSVARSVTVWRTVPSRLFAALPSDCRAALVDYADAVERVGASSGAVDPTSAGGVRSGPPTGPSLDRLAAAQTVDRVVRVLEGHAAQAHPCGARLPYRHLVDMLAIEEASTTAIARLLDPSPRNRPSRAAMTEAVRAAADAAARVALALGYRSE